MWEMLWAGEQHQIVTAAFRDTSMWVIALQLSTYRHGPTYITALVGVRLDGSSSGIRLI